MFWNEIRIPRQLPCFALLNYGTCVIDWDCRGGVEKKNPTANYLTLLPPRLLFLLPFPSPPRGKSKISCFNISQLHPPTYAPQTHSPSHTHTLPHTHPPMSQHLLLSHQIGRQSVECSSIVLLCQLRLVVCDLNAALMCLSLNPRSYLMISLSLFCVSLYLPLPLSGGHTIDCYLLTVSSSRAANCLRVTISGGLMCSGAEGCSSCLYSHSSGLAGVGEHYCVKALLCCQRI